MNNRPNNFFSSIPVVVKNLLFINIIMWLVTVILKNRGIVDLNDILGLHLFTASKFNPGQLFTYMFMHGGFEHVFFNMFTLFIFGRTLEQYWGPKRFFIFYIVTGVGAGLVQELTWYIELWPMISQINDILSSGVPPGGVHVGSQILYTVPELLDWKAYTLNLFVTIGASGAIFGLLLAFGMLFPNAQIFMIFFPIPIKAKYFVIIYGIIELFAGVRSHSDGIAHFAHLGGMLFGYILIKIWRKKGIY